MPDISVVICTHNPRPAYLRRVLDGLARQSMAKDRWELLLVDNASDSRLATSWNLSWHPQSHHVREERLGLTYARLRGFSESKGKLIVYVDDDNVLDRAYLQAAKDAMDQDDFLGACGGKVVPEYETSPPAWFNDVTVSLACQDLGDRPIYFSWIGLDPAKRKVPAGSPNGAGIVLRRSAYQYYVDEVGGDSVRLGLDRRGVGLTSGGDNDIVLTLMSRGYRTAYLPQLLIFHLIPEWRLSPYYLASLGYAAIRTWCVLHYVHDMPFPASISPWSAATRKITAFARNRAWRSWPNYIGWRQKCGQIDGRADVRLLEQRRYVRKTTI